MKKTTAALSTLLVTGSVYAASDADVYNGWEKGNPDLSTDIPTQATNVAGPPAVGDSFSPYGSWGVGNPDLYPGAPGGDSVRSDFPNIYGTFPEL